MNAKHIFVIGAGSVGKRHLRNFANLGCKVSAMDPREDRLAEAAEQVKLAKSFTVFESLLHEISSFDGVVVASPPKFHVQQCIDIAKAGVPILLEKPVSPTLEESLQLSKTLKHLSNAKLLLGYTYRWWPPLNEFYKSLKTSKIGKILHGKFVMSAHLTDWHPWEQYQDYFMASKEMGGGALLDESHFLDLMLWFFGMPDSVFAQVERISSLEIETDDNVDMIAIYNDGLRVTMHLDLYGRPHEKFITVTGENGTLHWSFEPNCVRYSKDIEQKWEEQYFDYERNDMFIRLAEEFIRILNGQKELSCTLNDGIKVLSIIEACRESSTSRKIMSIKEKQF